VCLVEALPNVGDRVVAALGEPAAASSSRCLSDPMLTAPR
jgi:hypothetical protein